VALLARGYYSGDTDIQSWIFGKGTAEALAQFQADNKLPASGKICTWEEGAHLRHTACERSSMLQRLIRSLHW
jgi:hypothetical protein